MRLKAAIILAWVLVMSTGCGEGGDDDELPALNEATIEDVQAGVDRGDTCQQLFDIRNNMPVKSPDANATNELLRSVGCYHSGATRTD